MPDEQLRQNPEACPFCTMPARRIVAETSTAMLVFDAYPVSKGHALVLPKRHIASWFDIAPDEQHDILFLLSQAKSSLQIEHSPDGYNIGINDGAAAGQTVPHLHLHLIPRYLGDSLDPRGGIRWVIPERAKYWP